MHGRSLGLEPPSPSRQPSGPGAGAQASEFQGGDVGLFGGREQSSLFPPLSMASCNVGMDGRLPSLPGPIMGRPALSGFGPHREQRQCS